MADGYTRASGKMSMMVAQNGPGITNFVTPVKTAYWNHTPLLLVTPQTANMAMGQGGFQEVPQMAVFEDMVAYQEEVRHPARIAEVLNRVIMQAKRASAPAQINVPRDFWTQVIDIELPAIVDFELPAGGQEAIAKGDVVLALGTRLNPFSTLPGYGINYWPTTASIIQVDINADRIGLTKPVTVGIVGDVTKVAKGILAKLSATAGDEDRKDRKETIEKIKADWATDLAGMDHEADDAGTTWNERARKQDPEKITSRMAWRAIKSALPKNAIISSDIGNSCALGAAYPTFEEGRKYLAPGMFGPCGFRWKKARPLSLK